MSSGLDRIIDINGLIKVINGFMDSGGSRIESEELITPMESISVQDLGDLIKRGKVKVGETYTIEKYKTIMGRMVTTELVYDVLDNLLVDTVIFKIGPIYMSKGSAVLRHRYTHEGMRSKLPIINPNDKRSEDYFKLINKARRRKNA